MEARVEFFRQDVADHMRSAKAEGLLWDLVILDPPKLAPNRKVTTTPASCEVFSCRCHQSLHNIAAAGPNGQQGPCMAQASTVLS